MPENTIIADLLFFFCFGLIGGLVSAWSGTSSGETPLHKVLKRAFVGGGTGLFTGLGALHLWPTVVEYRYMSAIAGGYVGPEFVALWVKSRQPAQQLPPPPQEPKP